MALQVNGTEVSSVTLNGNVLDKVTVNGTTVWENWKHNPKGTITGSADVGATTGDIAKCIYHSTSLQRLNN